MAKGMVEEVVTGNQEPNYYITKEFNNTTVPYFYRFGKCILYNWYIFPNGFH